MCGIAGVLTTRRVDQADAVVDAMLDLVAHRGPDGRGVVNVSGSRATATVGAVRLSLLDLSGGHQPMFSADGRTALVFNGEITNHQDLRRRHLRDHAFSSRSDTETLLALWERIGPDCVAQLEGMFALAVVRDGELWLSRDRAGIKPLFVHIDGSRSLSFASETKAFLGLPWFEPRLDSRAFIEHAVMSHPLDGHTWWQDVTELNPGTVFHVVTGDDGRLRAASTSFVDDGVGANDVDDNLDALGTVLEGCVERHLVSDHPSGVFLSGGLDSTVIAALASGARARSGATDRLHTFTFGDDEALEDVQAARSVAHTLGTEHHEKIVSLDEAVGSLAGFVWDNERPSADLGASLVIASAREHVKSALVGEGSDELFAGYWLHRDPLAYVRREISSYVRCYRWHGNVSTRELFEPMRRSLAWLAVRSDDERARRVRRFYLGSPLRNMHLHPWDHSSMAASLEVRVPYLSTEVYEYGEALMAQRPPSEWGNKLHLRQLARERLPEPLARLVTERPKRAGFSNFDRLHDQVAAYADRLVPEDHVAAHPLRHCVTAHAGSDALGVLLFDLFLMSFVVRRCGPTNDEDPTELYRRPAEMALLRDALAQIELPVNDPPLDGSATDVARAALAATPPAAG